MPKNAAAGAPVFECLTAEHVQLQLGRRMRNLQVVSVNEYVEEGRFGVVDLQALKGIVVDVLGASAAPTNAVLQVEIGGCIAL